VQPRFITDYDVRTAIPGMTSWRVQLVASAGIPLPPHGKQVSVRATTEGGRTFFGLAVLGHMTWTGGRDTVVVDAELVGTTALAERAS
jgi:hypothetical protein